MRLTPDTNVLLRPLLRDDLEQARLAEAALSGAELVALSTASLCELAWVLGKGYKKKPSEIAAAVRELTSNPSVVVDMSAVEAGLATLKAGGDFADGVIACQGRQAGGKVFVSFDRSAVKLVQETGGEARLLTS